MSGRRIGFCTRVREINPNVIIIHCFLHRENLATKTIQEELYLVLKDVISMVNFIKSKALNSRIFNAMCDEMGSQYKSLLYHSDVHWLSRGKILSRVISLRSEIHTFLTEKHHSLAEKVNGPAWVAKLAFLSDMFEHLNNLNTEMQGKNQTIVDIGEQISSFKLKLALWREKLLRGKIESF